MSRSARGHASDNGWNELPLEQIPGWNTRLLQTDAPYTQYPYWNEHLRGSFLPRYLVYETAEPPAAFYVCILTVGIPGISIGLVEGGPVSLLADSTNPKAAVRELARWARRHGYILLRFGHSNQQFTESIAAADPAERVDAFPFRKAYAYDLVIEQRENDNEMLASFSKTARYEITRAKRGDYTLEVTDSPDRFTELWPLFESRAHRKGFRLRPLQSYLNLIRFARPYECVRLYVAHLQGQPVQAILVVRDRATACYALGATDIDALQGMTSHSPSCLLHWSAMRDFYRLGVRYYSLVEQRKAACINSNTSFIPPKKCTQGQ